MYRKNVAGQYLCLCLVNATTGAPLTGATVTAYRSIDGAAQAAVTGTITEQGNGQYSLALSQADTNGNNIGYFFTATNAIPVNINIITTAADPTDSVRFGLTALPNAAAAAANGLPTSGSGANQLLTSSGLVRLTPTGAGDIWDVAIASHVAAGSTGLALSNAGSATDPWSIALPGAYGAGTAGAILGAVSSGVALTAGERTSVADALLTRAFASVSPQPGATDRNMLQALRFLRNAWITAVTTLTVMKEDDVTAAWTSNLTLNAGASPVTGSDPA